MSHKNRYWCGFWCVFWCRFFSHIPLVYRKIRIGVGFCSFLTIVGSIMGIFSSRLTKDNLSPCETISFTSWKVIFHLAKSNLLHCETLSFTMQKVIFCTAICHLFVPCRFRWSVFFLTSWVYRKVCTPGQFFLVDFLKRAYFFLICVFSDDGKTLLFTKYLFVWKIIFKNILHVWINIKFLHSLVFILSICVFLCH